VRSRARCTSATAPEGEWRIGSACVRAEAVSHRGPTLGFRFTELGASFCYLPDHEPALVAPLETVEPTWISGHSLAMGVDLLLHDCQYTDLEYPRHYGWGHSCVSDALMFAHRAGARRTLLAHHDPRRCDEALDRLHEVVRARWSRLGGDPHAIEMATELAESEVPSRASARLSA